MSELDAFLDSTNQTSANLQSLKFPAPGIFTNAIVRKPYIHALLRDANEQENSLYYINTKGKPERKDGRSGAIDRLNEEFENLETQAQQATNPNQELILEPARPSVIPVPVENTSILGYSQNKGVENLMSRFNEEGQLDHEVEVLCETVRQLIQKYPIRGTEERLSRYQDKWTKLKNDIAIIEKRIESQKRQEKALEDGEATLQEQEQIRYENLLQGQSPEKRTAGNASSIQEQIRETEFEIRKLRLELETRKRQSMWLNQDN